MNLPVKPFLIITLILVFFSTLIISSYLNLGKKKLNLLTEELFKRYHFLESVLFQNWVDESSLLEFE